MTAGSPENGSIIAYPYLWRWQAEKGETEGRKHRPVCLVLKISRREQNHTHLILLAISGTPPGSDQTAIAVPALERRRAGLLEWKDAWITVSEYNYDIAEQSFYFEPQAEIIGCFSPAFLGEIAQAFRPFIARREARIDRQG